MAEKEPTVEVLWIFERFVPDPRQYKPSAPSFVPAAPLYVSVDVPLKQQFVKNAVKITNGQLTGQDTPQPILTVQGMKYIIDMFESAMFVKPQDGKLESSVEILWENDEKAEVKTEQPSSSEVTWDNIETEALVEEPIVSNEDDAIDWNSALGE